jgi:hypothetical protein
VALTHLGKQLLEKKYLIAAMKSYLMTSQLFLKNKELYLSGPGALASEMENNAALISSSVMEVRAAAVEASVMVFGKMVVRSSVIGNCGAQSRFSKYIDAILPISCGSWMRLPVFPKP